MRKFKITLSCESNYLSNKIAETGAKGKKVFFGKIREKMNGRNKKCRPRN
jgi:hypothetical protein